MDAHGPSRRRRLVPWLAAGAAAGLLAASWLVLRAPGARPPGPTRERAALLIEAGRYAEAETVARTLLARAEAGGGHDSMEAAEPIDLILRSLHLAVRGKSPDARALGERALRIKEGALGPRHPAVAVTLGHLGLVLRQAGDHPAALGMLERALSIRQEALGPDHPEVATALGDLALCVMDMGDLDRSRALFEQALAIREAKLPPDHRDIATGLSNLALMLRNSGDYFGALQAHQRALAIREKALPPDHPDLALTLGHLGSLLYLTGDFAAARPLFERSLQVRIKAFGPVNPRVAEAMNSLADLLRDTGDYEEARSLYAQALVMWKQTLGPRHFLTALSCDGLGRLHHTTGDLAAAESQLREGLEILEAAAGPRHPLVGVLLQDLADVIRDRGDRAAARPLYERALAIREGVPSPNLPEVSSSLIGLARLMRDAGDGAGALGLCRRALDLQVPALGPGHPSVAVTLDELARVHWLRGERADALERSLAAEEILREHLRLTARSLSEREALQYEKNRLSGLEVALSVLAAPGGGAPGDASRRVWDGVIRARALVLDEMASRRRAALEIETATLLPLVERLREASEAYARLVVRGQPGDNIEPFRAGVDRARDRMEEAERDLAASSAAYRRRQELEKVTLSAVVSALPPGSGLVAYVQHRRLAPGRGDRSAGPSYLALIARADRAGVVALPLGPADAIDPLVAAWREQAGSPARDAASLERYRQAGARLRGAIWDPLARHLRGAGKVFVVPDGALHMVSIATLPAADGRYLIETGPLVHYLSAERDLVSKAGSPGTRGRGVLVMGGPDFESGPLAAGRSPAGGALAAMMDLPRNRGSTCDFGSLRFQPLPGAALEADEVESLWRSADPAVVKLTGRRAGEAAFKRSAPGRKILHLATHGFFFQGECPGDAGAAASSPARQVNPLQLSGLALAGANLRDRAGRSGQEEDGILTAEEIAAIDLRGVEWAVLSACETGVGPVQTGEGVLGLRRAFEIAGVQTLILSLWPVSDHDARDWIRHLYRGRLAGLGTAEALREASLRILRERREAGATTHPSSWGAFVAAGSWQ